MRKRNAMYSWRPAILLILAFIIAGCSESLPSRYYVLNTMAPPGGSKPSEGRTLAIPRVELPEYLNRPAIIRRETQNRLDLAQFEQWAEPLDVNLTRVMTEDLAYLLQGDGFVVVPSGIADAELTLLIEFLRFERSAEGDAVLAALWRLRDAVTGEQLILRRSSYQRPVDGSDFDSLISAMNRLTHQLSHEIANVITDSVS
ncbi:PqiC family protein [Ferruginivarius sediminum]|uniref:ABC-type transport auxiliary lipoprotein component domain-containing protein n=1 Tax=Ferruginivarius sediminum TaxID=2661937 RepID=A0A369T6M8_9PROT|nr:PqiC family protein [Ferruginivarius sediminum]RDD60928.1 hypothetical protein DRB17_15830 [Ferruginivarius sediminum]